MKAILAEAGLKFITRKTLRHLPKTEAILKQFREDRFQFAVRRIRMSASRMREEGQFSYRGLLHESNIGKALLQRQNVQNALIREVNGMR
jgi:hypothetical protein